ncbi:unnamed protein product [Trichobilharzia szidati]|nr:unnamed protein product [Trichobilharzia szidati]
MVDEVGERIITVNLGKRIIDPKYGRFLSDSVPVGIEATEHLQFSVDDSIYYSMPITNSAVITALTDKFLSPISCYHHHETNGHPCRPKIKHFKATTNICIFNSSILCSSNTVQLLQPTCCHILLSGDRFKSVSVDHLGCLDQGILDGSHQTINLSQPFISCEHLNSILTEKDIPIGSRSAGDGQTDDEELDGANCSVYPETIQFKNNPVSTNSSSDVKCHLGSLSHLSSPPISLTNNQVDTQHLLLPGRSEFEQRLVREVAYFELCEFLIEQIEEIYDLETFKLLDLPENKKHTNLPSEMQNDRQMTSGQAIVHSPHNPFTSVSVQNLIDQTENMEHYMVDSATGLAVSLINTCIKETVQHVKHETIFCKLCELRELMLHTSDIDWVHLNQSSTSFTKAEGFTQDNKLQHLLKSSSFSKSSEHSVKSPENSRQSPRQRWTSFHFKSYPQPTTSSKPTLNSLSQSGGGYLSTFLNSFNSVRNNGKIPETTVSVNTNPVKLNNDDDDNNNDNNNTNSTVDSALKDGNNSQSLISLIRDFKLSDRQDNPRVPLSTHRSSLFDFVCTPLPYGLLINPPVHKSKRKAILTNQNNRCAGCGAFIETRYLKRMRFCEFFGRYFCCVCHSNTLMTLPGNLLTCWDFRMLPVSNFARDRLHQLHNQPLLRTIDFNKQVLNRQSSLIDCLTLRRQGNLMLPFIRRCQAAQQLMEFERIPSHWLETPDLWSMADLHAVHDGKMSTTIRTVLLPIVEHIPICERCLAQGFICEVCKSGQILFPFGQVNTVTCPTCSACFHRVCLPTPKPEICPRCIRRAAKREQLT